MNQLFQWPPRPAVKQHKGSWWIIEPHGVFEPMGPYTERREAAEDRDGLVRNWCRRKTRMVYMRMALRRDLEEFLEQAELWYETTRDKPCPPRESERFDIVYEQWVDYAFAPHKDEEDW